MFYSSGDARINSVNLPVKKGERVYLSLAKANVDVCYLSASIVLHLLIRLFQVECFAKPQNIDPRRASQPSAIIGDPLTKCLGDDFMFKVCPMAYVQPNLMGL